LKGRFAKALDSEGGGGGVIDSRKSVTLNMLEAVGWSGTKDAEDIHVHDESEKAPTIAALT
jgi:hypothetical protein